MVESQGKGDMRNIEVLDAEVRRNIDLEFLETACGWMEELIAQDQPIFINFNHSNVHFSVLPRAEYQDSSDGGAAADCIQMVGGDFKVLLDKLDVLGLYDNTIVILVSDNGRDTSFHAPGNRSGAGHWRDRYCSTNEGNRRTAGIIRWAGKIEPRKSDEMMHITDWLPTLLTMVSHHE
jgi:arylsulfatase A-like enzyme